MFEPGRRWRGLRRLGGALAAAVALAACTTVGGLPALPGSSHPAFVRAAIERGPYLDGVIERRGEVLRLFFPDSEACREVVRTENMVEWVVTGAFGEVRDGELVCPVVGIADLGYWRDQRSRPAVQAPTGRQATYRVLHEDEDLVLVRGLFPLTGRLGWGGGQDTVAAIPNIPACRDVLGRHTATVDYRDSAPEPYQLVSGRGLCPVRGFLRPPPNP